MFTGQSAGFEDIDRGLVKAQGEPDDVVKYVFVVS